MKKVLFILLLVICIHRTILAQQSAAHYFDKPTLKWLLCSTVESAFHRSSVLFLPEWAYLVKTGLWGLLADRIYGSGSSSVYPGKITCKPTELPETMRCSNTSPDPIQWTTTSRSPMISTTSPGREDATKLFSRSHADSFRAMPFAADVL